MIVKMSETEHICNSAKRTKTSIVLTKSNEDGTTATFVFLDRDVVETAEVIEGAWEYDALAEPSQADRIEAQVTYTAMMTDTLLEV